MGQWIAIGASVAFIEQVVFSELTILGYVPFITLVYLVWVFRFMGYTKFLLLSLWVGFFIDILKGSTLTYTIAYVLIAILMVTVKDILQDDFSHRNVALSLPMLMVLLSAGIVFVSGIGLIGSINEISAGFALTFSIIQVAIANIIFSMMYLVRKRIRS